MINSSGVVILETIKNHRNNYEQSNDENYLTSMIKKAKLHG